MDKVPYASPSSKLEDADEIIVPKSILKKIRNALIAGLVSIGITVIATLISMSGMNILDFDAWAFIDVGIMLILVYGIYKNSRIAAILMLLLFAANKLVVWFEFRNFSALLLAIVFLWYYTQGVIGTFQYHKFIKNNKA